MKFYLLNSIECNNLAAEHMLHWKKEMICSKIFTGKIHKIFMEKYFLLRKGFKFDILFELFIMIFL